MRTIKGPGIFLAQFLGDKPPFNDLKSICQWAKSIGFIGVQIPTWDARCIDLQKAAESKTYCDEWKGLINEYGLEITELSTHLQGQLVAVHPAYDALFDAFAPEQQPEMWAAGIIQKMYDALMPGGVLVSYSSKSSFQITLKQVGFAIEKLAGPPGKREMVRAFKK